MCCSWSSSLHGDLAKIAAKRGAAAAVGDRPAGDDDAHRVAAGDEILHRLADLGALAFVRHLVESVEQQQDVAAILEQADEEVDRQVEGRFATDQVVRDEGRQRLLVCRGSGRQLASVARERGQRYEDWQWQLARRHRQAEARVRWFGLAGEQRRGQRPSHVQQHRRLAAARPADDRQTIAEPEDLVQGDVGFAAASRLVVVLDDLRAADDGAAVVATDLHRAFAEPLNWLSFSPKNSRVVRLPNSGGMGPLIVFSYKISNRNVSRLPSSGGIGPLRRLRPRYRVLVAVRRPNSGGIDPSRSLLPKLNVSR